MARQSKRSRRKWSVDAQAVRQHLGSEKYIRELTTRVNKPGVVIALAYTPVGGEVLFIEAAAYPGSGKLTLTGQIGDVMKESAVAAISLYKTRAHEFNFDHKFFEENDLHIHVPAGAVPKDGPSAGGAIYTAIASLLLDIPLRPTLAMTGEITLRGLVLPVGGIKEKALAAARVGIKTVLLPKLNAGDLDEVDSVVRKKLKFVLVENVGQMLDQALGKRQLAQAARANRLKIRTKQPGSTPKKK